jgi:hypothetical protein
VQFDRAAYRYDSDLGTEGQGFSRPSRITPLSKASSVAVKLRGGLTAATETLGKFDLAASPYVKTPTETLGRSSHSERLQPPAISSETGNRDAVGLQCRKAAHFALKVTVEQWE